MLTLRPPVIAPGRLLQGAYAGPANPSGVAAFGAATGTGSQIALGVSAFEQRLVGHGRGRRHSVVADQRMGRQGIHPLIGVPIIPTNSSGTAVGSLATGATGAYNSYFVTLAQTL